jgi:hypothetical protein
MAGRPLPHMGMCIAFDALTVAVTGMAGALTVTQRSSGPSGTGAGLDAVVAVIACRPLMVQLLVFCDGRPGPLYPGRSACAGSAGFYLLPDSAVTAAWEGADSYEHVRRTGGLCGGVMAPVSPRPGGWRVAVLVLRSGVDGGLAGPRVIAGAAAGASGGAGPRVRAYRGGVLRRRIEPDRGVGPAPGATPAPRTSSRFCARTRSP